MAVRRFSADERAWLASQRLGRLATVSPDGVVGNAPVTYFVRSDDTIDIGGMRMGATKKFRNVQAGSRVAFVVDTVDTSAGWDPIYLEIRGTAEALSDEQAGIVRLAGAEIPVPRFGAQPPTRESTGHIVIIKFHQEQGLTRF